MSKSSTISASLRCVLLENVKYTIFHTSIRATYSSNYWKKKLFPSDVRQRARANWSSIKFTNINYVCKLYERRAHVSRSWQRRLRISFVSASQFRKSPTVMKNFSIFTTRLIQFAAEIRRTRITLRRQSVHINSRYVVFSSRCSYMNVWLWRSFEIVASFFVFLLFIYLRRIYVVRGSIARHSDELLLKYLHDEITCSVFIFICLLSIGWSKMTS